MRTIRRRNWLIRRFAVGLAIAAVAAPAAQARVDEGIQGQPNSSDEIQTGIAYQQFVTDFPSYPAGSVADIGALPVSARDYALAGAERVRLAHSLPRWTDPGIVASMHASRAMPHDPALTSGDQSQPRSIGEPQVVSASFDWKDAGIGAGLVLTLGLLGGGTILVSRHVGREQTA
jgi:hypothetical protein